MGIFAFDVERLREVVVQLSDEKNSDKKLCRSKKNEVVLSQNYSFEQIKH